MDLGLAVAIVDDDDSGSPLLDDFGFLNWLFGDDVTCHLEWPEGSFEDTDPSRFQRAQLEN